MRKNQTKKKSQKLNLLSFSNLPIQQFNNFLLFFFILLLPTQLGKHFFFDFSYLSGIRVDYLAPTIYLTDIIAFVLITFNFKSVIDFFRQKKILLFISLLFLNVFVSQFPVISMYRYIKILELIGIAVIIKQNNFPILKASIAFLVTALLEVFIAGYQFLTKHSLQGLFYFLGERPLNLSMPGIAKAALNGIEFLRPYGTFSHPNSLAGFYLLIYIFILTKGGKLHFIFKNIVLFLCSLLIFLSFSKIAIITYLVINVIYILKSSLNKDCRFCFYSRITIFGILSLIFLQATSDPLSLQKRIKLAQNSLSIIAEQPLFGAGLGNYLIAQNRFPQKFADFLNQPVHNIFLLIISELGIIIPLLLLILFWQEIKTAVKNNFYLILVITLTGIFDHYWLTLQQNFLILGVILGLI